MVKLLIGHKGSGKTKRMIELANGTVQTAKGSIVFINKNSRLIYKIKVISKESGIDFVLSVSAELEEMIGVDFDNIEVLN